MSAIQNGPLRASVFLAESILRLGHGLAAAIAAYREAILPAPDVRPTFDIIPVAF